MAVAVVGRVGPKKAPGNRGAGNGKMGRNGAGKRVDGVAYGQQ